MKFIAYIYGDYSQGIGCSALIILSEDKKEILYEWTKARKSTGDKVLEQEMGAAIRAVMSVPNGSFLEIVSGNDYAVRVLSGEKEPDALVKKFLEEKEKKHIVSTIIWKEKDDYATMVTKLCTRGVLSFRNGSPAVLETKNRCYDYSENLY